MNVAVFLLKVFVFMALQPIIHVLAWLALGMSLGILCALIYVGPRKERT